MSLSLEQLEQKITAWATARGIHPNSDMKAQTLKGFSEMGELADHVIKTQPEENGDRLYADKDREAVKDDIGDVVVCLINVAHKYDLTLLECVEQAWNDIKDRRGFMSANGAFVKEA